MSDASSRGWPGRGGRRGERVILVVSIDTECDKGPAWRTQFPLSFRSITEALPEVLMPLFRRHGVIPTFLLSPEVIQNDESVRVLGGLRDCELGTHLHGEFVEPETNPAALVTDTPQSAYDADIEERKLANLTEMFRTRFRRQPRSFRGGLFALSSNTLRILDSLGYEVDSSVTPFRTNRYHGGLECNYWGASLHPYHPSGRDARRPGNLRLCEVPVTLFNPHFARWPAVLLRRLNDRTARRINRMRFLGAEMRTFWVRPFRGSADELAEWSEAVIGSWRGPGPPLINVMFHSVEAQPAASPYAQTEGDVGVLVDSLARLFAHLRRRYGVESVGLADAAGRSVGETGR
jgi:hypothetical protein